jgi:hypothetical protein
MEAPRSIRRITKSSMNGVRRSSAVEFPRLGEGLPRRPRPGGSGGGTPTPLPHMLWPAARLGLMVFARQFIGQASPQFAPDCCRIFEPEGPGETLLSPPLGRQQAEGTGLAHGGCRGLRRPPLLHDVGPAQGTRAAPTAFDHVGHDGDHRMLAFAELGSQRRRNRRVLPRLPPSPGHLGLPGLF